MPGARRLFTFLLHGRCFGIEVERVQEVIRSLETTRVPLAPPAVSGLINLRGRIVTAVDLRSCLDLPPRPEEVAAVNVVVRSGGEEVSLLVDDIGDVIEVDDATFEPPPEALRGAAREMIRGAHKLEERLLLVLDAEKALGLIPHGE